MKINHNGKLRKVLMDFMKENNISMRKLSERTGIDTAIISKIINGKRKATLEHLYTFAENLNVPVTSLLETADHQTEAERQDVNPGTIASVLDFLNTSGALTEVPPRNCIEEKLSEYENYSLTDQGKQTIINNFKSKLKRMGGKGCYIQQLEMMFERFRHNKGTKTEMMLMGGALLYFIFTMDVVPDYIFPVGYLDDALVIQMTMHSLSGNKI